MVGVDIVEEAIVDARRNAAENGVTNADFVAAKAEDIMPKLLSCQGLAEVLSAAREGQGFDPENVAAGLNPSQINEPDEGSGKRPRLSDAREGDRPSISGIANTDATGAGQTPDQAMRLDPAASAGAEQARPPGPDQAIQLKSAAPAGPVQAELPGPDQAMSIDETCLGKRKREHEAEEAGRAVASPRDSVNGDASDQPSHGGEESKASNGGGAILPGGRDGANVADVPAETRADEGQISMKDGSGSLPEKLVAIVDPPRAGLHPKVGAPPSPPPYHVCRGVLRCSSCLLILAGSWVVRCAANHVDGI